MTVFLTSPSVIALTKVKPEEIGRTSIEDTSEALCEITSVTTDAISRFLATLVISGRYFDVIGNQMQSLVQVLLQPGFRSNNGPGGLEDMFRATVVGFDFLGTFCTTRSRVLRVG